MQLFSRNKAFLAASLSALVALGACGDNVTVPVAPAAVVTISITPPSATMNVGERLNFAVQITGGSTTAAPTLASCTSSNNAVATAASAGSACAVTAVAPGNATITAAASTGQVAAAAVNVAAIAPAITSLAVSPSAAQLAVGQSVTLVGTVQPAGRTVAFIYGTSSTAIATVSTTGVVAAVAPGVATITVTATGSGTGFASATIAQAVTITVSDRVPGLTALNVQPNSLALSIGQTAGLAVSAAGPSASSAVITYGTTAPTIATVTTAGVVTAVAPGTGVITVTATSAQAGAFAASTITALVPVTVSPAAQVIINSLTDNGAAIDITNVAGQFEVNLSLQPNGQRVSSVQTYVCKQGEAQADCIARGPAAQQTFGSAGGQAGPIQLYINSAEFTTPDFTTGADANTLYKNGLKTMIATVTTTPANTGVSASNNLSQINFNNVDGWTIDWKQPSNKANDAAGNTWYGGPTTPDALTPTATSGLGSFTMVPVVYTENRTVVTATLNMSGLACGNNILDSTRPFAATYGVQTRSTSGVAFNCTAGVSDLNGYAPSVISSIDNNNAAYQAGATGGTLLAATSIFTPISSAAISSPTFAGRYRQSLAYRPTTIYIPGDYLAPSILRYDVKGNGGTGIYVDSGWVTSSYSLAGGFSSSTGNPLRLDVNDNLTFGVGLLGSGSTTSARNTVFNVCNMPNPIPSTSAFVCSSPVASGGISSTILSIGLGENATDFTNSAYVTQVIETDRLGNRSTSNPFNWTDSNNNAFLATPGWASQVPNANIMSAQAFGVDVTAPALVTLPNSGGTGTNPVFPNYARTDLDSIYSTLGNTYSTTDANNAQFAVRFNDLRSGFTRCTTTGSSTAQICPDFANSGTEVAAGTFAISRVTTDQAVSLTNTAVVESIVIGSNTSATTTNRRLNVINAVIAAGDPGNREWSINIYGAANRVRNTTTLSRTPAASVAGYYTFTGSLVDRAGNTTTITQRSVAIDNAAPQITGIQVPAIMQGASTSVAFVPSGTDDLEAIAGDLRLDYPQLANEGITAVSPAQPVGIRFRRVSNFPMGGTAVLGLWHNPFVAITETVPKLTTPVGPGLALSSAGLTVPIPFVQQIQSVTNADAPYTATVIAPAAMKPNQVTAWLYDIRATATSTGTTGSLYAITGISSAQTAPLFDGQVTQPATAKDWTATGVGIQTWAAFSIASASSVEFRVATSTSVTNPPFTRVEMIRAGATEWTHLGQAVYAGSLDQGATRYWRYTFSFAGISQGQGSVAALANLDVLRAIGTDAAGNGISTKNWTVGGPVNAVTSLSVSPGGPVFVPSNGFTNNYQLTASASQPSGAVTASITYAVWSNTGFTIDATQLLSGNVSIAAGFTPGATATIRVSALGTASTGFLGNTVIKDIVFNSGVAGISAVSITGAFPATMQPGATVTLTATPTQPVGAPTPTYLWTTPAGFTQSASGNSVTFTWVGSQSIVTGASATMVTATTAQVAPGFAAATANSTATTNPFDGFWNTDVFSLALTGVNQSINAGGTNALTLTPTFSSNVANNTTTCASSNINAATISSPAGVITASALLPNVNFTSAQTVSFTCTQSRTLNTFGGFNFAARSVSSNTVSALILPWGLQSVTLSPTQPGTLLVGQTFAITATSVLATGAGAVTHTAVSSAVGTATVAVSGSTITVTGVAAGAATITVTSVVPATAGLTTGNTIVTTYSIIVQ